MSGFHYIEFSKTGSILLNAEEKDELFGYIDRLKAENVKLRELLQRTWNAFHDATAHEFVTVKNELRELGIEVDA